MSVGRIGGEGLKSGSKLLVTYGWRAEICWKWVPDNRSNDREALSTILGCSLVVSLG